MYLKFFSEPNNEVVDRVMMEFDPVRLRGTMMVLPTAIQSMLSTLDYWPEKDEEADRRDLNGVIVLTEMMIEIIEGVYTNKNVRTLDSVRELYDVFDEAAQALEAVQAAKDVRIADTHAKYGKNFGAATGFQQADYRSNAKTIREFLATF